MDNWFRALLGAAFLPFLVLLLRGPILAADGPAASDLGPTNPAATNVSADKSTNVPPANPAPNDAAITNLDPTIRTMLAVQELMARQAEETLRSHLRLQEQLHTALLAIQQSRQDSSAEAQTNVSTMLGRLESLERELGVERAQEAEAARHSSRLMLLAAVGIFVTGVLAMVLTVVIQARGMNRLAEIAVGLSPARALPGLHDPLPLSLASGGGDRLLLGVDGAGRDVDGGRLHSTIRQLEGRIRDIEAAARTTPEPAVRGGPEARVIVVAKAQAFMNLGQPEAALEVLDEAIAREPANAELQLRRGMALERLKQLDPAIEAYDRAISIDGRCTQAYVSKGGILNQQARYQEALACYEQALEFRARS